MIGFEKWIPIELTRVEREYDVMREMEKDDILIFLDEEVEPQILSIIRNAMKYVRFVTPYLRLWGHLRNAIDRAISKGVEISFITRTGEDKSIEDKEWLFDHKVKLYEIENLHAKIYLNENTVLISSMNITRYSTTNSLEFAMIVQNGKKDAMRFRDYVSEMMRRAEPIQFAQSGEQEIGQAGVCVRCGRQIDFNVARPLCDNCYQSWVAYSDEEYPERYCHSCGNSSQVSYARPLCITCYEKQR